MQVYHAGLEAHHAGPEVHFAGSEVHTSLMQDLLLKCTPALSERAITCVGVEILEVLVPEVQNTSRHVHLMVKFHLVQVETN